MLKQFRFYNECIDPSVIGYNTNQWTLRNKWLWDQQSPWWIVNQRYRVPVSFLKFKRENFLKTFDYIGTIVLVCVAYTFNFSVVKVWLSFVYGRMVIDTGLCRCFNLRVSTLPSSLKKGYGVVSVYFFPSESLQYTVGVKYFSGRVKSLK